MRRFKNVFHEIPSSKKIDFACQIFCSGLAKYAGQPAGVVVAETRAAALKAAALVVIKYKASSKPILSTRDALEQSKKKVCIIKNDLGDDVPKCKASKYED